MNDWLPVSRRTISHTYTHRDTCIYMYENEGSIRDMNWK